MQHINLIYPIKSYYMEFVQKHCNYLKKKKPLFGEVYFF